MRQCVYCEAALPENAHFCGHCGRLVETPSGDGPPGLPGKPSEHEYPTMISQHELDALSDAHTELIVDAHTPDNVATELIAHDPLSEIEHANTLLLPPEPPFASEPDHLPTLQQGAIQAPNEEHSEYATENIAISDLAERDEQEQRRRAMLLGGVLFDDLVTLPGSGTPPAGNAPALYATPQPGDAALLHGTPQIGSAPAQGMPLNSTLHARPDHLMRAGHQMYPDRLAPQQPYPPHEHTGPAPQQPHHPGRHTGPLSHHPHRRHTGPLSKALTRHTSRWLLIVSAAIVILSSAAIGAALATAPILSASGLSGNNTVQPGSVLHLHGKGFFPGGHVTLQRENGQPLTPQTHTTTANADSHLSLQENAALLHTSLQEQAATNTINVTSSGTFDADILIDTSWTPGQHAIYAVEDIFSRRASMPFLVDAVPPSLIVQPATLACGNLVQGVKAALSLNLSNGGGQPLDWSIDTGGNPWLIVQTQTGTIQPKSAPQVVAITCDTSTIKVGHYSTTIHLNSTATNQNITVTLNVLPAPVKKAARLSVSSNTLDFGAVTYGHQAFLALTMSNTGTDVLNWQLNVPTNAAWLHVTTNHGSIQTGGNPQRVIVWVNTVSLAKGTYTALLSATSNGGSAQISILMNVTLPVVPTPTPLPTPTPTPVVTPTPIVTPTPTPTPVVTPTPTPVVTPTPTPKPTPTPSPTPAPFPPTPTPTQPIIIY